MDHNCLGKLLIDKLEAVGRAKRACEDSIEDRTIHDLISKHNPIWDMVPDSVHEIADLRGVMYQMYSTIAEVYDLLSTDEE